LSLPDGSAGSSPALAQRHRPAPAPAEAVLPRPPARPAWRFGALLALLAAAATGLWSCNAADSGAAPTATPTPQQTATPAKAPAAAPIGLAAPGAVQVSPPWAGIRELLQRPASAQWRWNRFEGNPAVVVIEFPDLREQGLAMNRLAAMFEKRMAHRDRVLTPAELDELMRRSGDTIASFYQGHDYPAAKVARFYAQAEAQGVALNDHEARLRALLTGAGLMKRGATGAFQAMGDQAVVSFTGVQPDDPATAPDELVDNVRREAVLRHELSHGEFFTNPAYRRHCMNFWRHVLREPERRMFIAYLQKLDYNPGDEELMANETQALLMHTPDGRAFNAGSLGISESALAQLRSRFRVGEPVHGLRR
jgi:hypothetical protein